MIATGSGALGTVKLWDVARRTLMATLVTRGSMVQVAFSPNGRTPRPGTALGTHEPDTRRTF